MGSSRSSRSARGRGDAALQHDTRCAEDLRRSAGAGRGLRFDQRVEALLNDAPDIALIVRPLLVAVAERGSRSASISKRIEETLQRDLPA